jgi:hypothetical protein
MVYGDTRDLILCAIVEGGPLSCREIMSRTGLSQSRAYDGVSRVWKSGRVLRTAEPVYEVERVFRGRAGSSRHTRPYHLYMVRPEGVDQVIQEGRRFVAFSEEYLDPRGGSGTSKAKRILSFLEANRDRAFFAKEVAEALGKYGVRQGDIMANVRRFERRGLVYVRGYKTDERETPFRSGYLVTWMGRDGPRDEALMEAISRTDAALQGMDSSNPTIERVHRIRDIVLEHSRLRQLVSPVYIESKLGCTGHEMERSLRRALQLYPDLKVVKLFDAYRYLHHDILNGQVLAAATEMKKNYIRIIKGAANRVGHNWEAVAEWFIDRTTRGASFWTQNHRKGGMDSRRIILYLTKGVGGRRSAAEVDRVWDVTPGLFAPEITYVLSCKWGLVSKEHVDDFLEVLKWSKEFGVDTSDGREMRQGVVGVFAAGAFKPNESVELKDGERISLASYASRRNLKLVTAADFNKMLRSRGCPKEATAQKICRAARDEAQVRKALDAFWEKPAEAVGTLGRLSQENQGLYRFEEMLKKGEPAEAGRHGFPPPEPDPEPDSLPVPETERLPTSPRTPRHPGQDAATRRGQPAAGHMETGHRATAPDLGTSPRLQGRRRGGVSAPSG